MSFEDYQRIKASPFFIAETTLGLNVVASEEVQPGMAIAIGPNGLARIAKNAEENIGVAVAPLCAHCKQPKGEHGSEGKCLFESTTYATDGTVIVRLNSQRF